MSGQSDLLQVKAIFENKLLLGQRFYEISLHASHQYLTNDQSWNIRFGRQTKHPTQKFTSMNLLEMP